MSTTVNETSFGELSRRIVEDFLQTIVVVDDEAYFQEHEASFLTTETDTQSLSEIKEPSPRGQPETVAVNAADPVRRASTSHQLDAKILIDSFALKGLVCAVLAPGVNEDLAPHTAKSASAADILVLDWQLGKDNGAKATSILRKILENDAELGGRLRLFVIYTGEPNLKTNCYDPLKAALSSLQELSENKLILGTKTTRVIFIKKAGGNPNEADVVDEKGLPERLISEFLEFTTGIVPGAAMASIASIRRETHRLLARFTSGLDAPFLAHRILSKTPTDAQHFLIDLVGDEMRAILETHDVGDKAAGSAIIESFVREPNPSRLLQIKTSKNASDNGLQAVTLNEVVTAIQNGIDGVPQEWLSKSHLFKRIHPLFNSNAAQGLERCHDFSRLSALRREAYGDAISPKAWLPRLSLGSIICDCKDRFYVCLQPVCDCVRLACDIQHKFVFAPFDNDSDRFDLVVNDRNRKATCLLFDPKPSKLRIFAFIADAQGVVRGERNNADVRFHACVPHMGKDPEDDNVAAQDAVATAHDTASSDSTSPAQSATPSPASGPRFWDFFWIGDLREQVAQRLVHRASTELSRIGLDEFEWQRKFSARSNVE